MQNNSSLYISFNEETELLDPVIQVGNEPERKETIQVNLNSIDHLHNSMIPKRILDVIGSLFGLIIFVMMYPFIAIAIKLSSRGAVLFKQKRTGKNGKVFECYKFRTMRKIGNKKNEDDIPDITQVGDERIFAFGNLLRITNLDELPQLINVLKGEMSLVGPRPFPVDECRYWRKQIPNFELRYIVKPGLTGWAQTTGYRGGTLDTKHMIFRLKRDFKYIENYSFWLDVKIILRTVRQMLHFDTKAH